MCRVCRTPREQCGECVKLLSIFGGHIPACSAVRQPSGHFRMPSQIACQALAHQSPLR